MSKKAQATGRTLTVAEAAAEMGVKPATVIGWGKKGQLAIIVPPGRTLDDSRSGQKTLRIERADWEAFLRACKVSGTAARPEQGAETGRPAAIAAGTDGKVRLKKLR